jgi:hypothetical protein
MGVTSEPTSSTRAIVGSHCRNSSRIGSLLRSQASEKRISSSGELAHHPGRPRTAWH